MYSAWISDWGHNLCMKLIGASLEPNNWLLSIILTAVFSSSMYVVMGPCCIHSYNSLQKLVFRLVEAIKATLRYLHSNVFLLNGWQMRERSFLIELYDKIRDTPSVELFAALANNVIDYCVLVFCSQSIFT